MQHLSAEERDAYDLILHKATHDDSKLKPSGEYEKWPSSEFGTRLLAGLQAEESDWAKEVLNEGLLTGLQKLAKDWLKVQRFITMPNGEQKLAYKSAYVGVRKQQTGHQQVLWADTTLDELWQILMRSQRIEGAAKLEGSITIRLIDLCTEQGKTVVSEALEAIDMTLDEFLAS